MQKALMEETGCCPNCGAPAETLHKDGNYHRDFICYQDNAPCYTRIAISCVECASCGCSHALEPSVIVPYCSYSLGFLMHVIYAKLTKRFATVEELCEHFEISVSTYYRIYKRFLVDSILIKQLSTVSGILEVFHSPLHELHLCLSLFYRTCGRSFLQPCVRLRPKIILKNFPADASRYIDNGVLP